MFFGADRDRLVKAMFVAAEESRREGDGGQAEARFNDALAELREIQRSDFEGIFRAMRGLPVTIRLLDPPLDEFLPVEYFEGELAALERDGAEPDEIEGLRRRVGLVQELHEANPMLGTRGVRLAILCTPPSTRCRCERSSRPRRRPATERRWRSCSR